MNMNETCNSIRHKIPLIEVLSITMYLVWFASGRIFSMEQIIPQQYLDDGVDFVKLAEAMGAEGGVCNTGRI